MGGPIEPKDYEESKLLRPDLATGSSGTTGGSEPHVQRSRWSERLAALAVGLVLMSVAGLAVWSFANPGLDIPIISKVVCSAKGGVWTSGSGCDVASATTGPTSGLSDSELVNKTESAATEMRGILDAYLSVYNDTQALDPNSWKEIVDDFHGYSPEIDRLLTRAGATQEELSQLLDEVIDRGLISEVAAGRAVDPQDYRDYVAVIGEWVSNQQQQNLETSVCFEKPSKKEGLACVLQTVTSTAAKGLEIAARLNRLQTSLFGAG